MNKLFEAYIRLEKAGIIKDVYPEYTGDYSEDKKGFKLAIIRYKNINPDFKLLK